MNHQLLCASAAALALAQAALAADFDAAHVRKLADQPDDRSSVAAEMRLFPSASEYDIEFTATGPGREPYQTPVIKATERLVQGKYLVTRFRPPDAADDLIMVVFYDQSERCYKKFVLAPDGTVSSSIGTRTGDSRSLSWVTQVDGERVILCQEQHGDEQVTWREVFIMNGKVVQIVDGVATITKRPAS